jgi:hypothetical protein
MQRLITESRIEYSQETDLPVHGAVFWISTEIRPRLQTSAIQSQLPEQRCSTDKGLMIRHQRTRAA